MVIVLLALILFALLFPGLLRFLILSALALVGVLFVMEAGRAAVYASPQAAREQMIIRELDAFFLATRNCGFHNDNNVLGPYLRSKFHIPPSDETTLGPENQRIAYAMALYEERHEGVEQSFCDSMWRRFGDQGTDAPHGLTEDY